MFSLAAELVLTCGKDKHFVWHCSETGRRLGHYITGSWCTSLEFDAAAQYAFVGDYSGTITVLRVQGTDSSLITKLSAHAGEILCDALIK